MRALPWTLLLAAAGCGGQRGFVRGDDAPARVVEVRKEQDYARSFEDVRNVLASRFTIGRSSPEQGILETEWSSDWPKPGQKKYIVRAVTAFEPDRRRLALRVEAESGKPGVAVPGRDLRLEELLAGELQAALQPPGSQEPPPPPPPAPGLPVGKDSGRADLRLTAGVPSLRAVVQTDDPGSSDTQFKFRDNGFRGGLELSVQAWKYVWIAFGYSHATWSGEETLSSDTSFDGVSFPAGSPLDLRMTLDRFDVGPKMVYDPGDRGFAEGQVRLSYLSENLEVESGAQSAEDGNSLFLLGVRGRGGLRFGDPYLVAEVGVTIGYPAITWGIEVGLGGGLRFGNVELEIGYRASYLNAFQREPEDLGIGVTEPYVSLLIRF